MKKIITLFLILSALNMTSQTFSSIDVKGKIMVESNDVAGITIFNTSLNKGTISNENGEFTLTVRLHDIIEVSALQFQNIKFKVNKDIIASKTMKIFLIEEINRLDEIVLLPNKLSGNLEADLQATKLFKPKLDALYYGIKHKEEFEFENDNKTKVDNKAIPTQHVTMVNGLNIINVVDQLLLPLFRSKASNKKERGIPDVPVEAIKYYFGSDFLVDNFDIPEHRVEEFIAYVESSDFDFSLLNYGNEMEFLELLHSKSIEFLKLTK
ncbi:carboxypeptidase-like regulatory domain-containing protein [Thalassobellus suaedae]|uniref:Carboxypeptidase-like regulatory domain-containing protein n=1 Tax=Thalassobellus suaedae TaxID=3074124 RepID=A0ABY9Y605_9FLAO|nr:carboxypeptidase-like regulatory domain-containing protein [Flavobacteriaceae bacterium HL-DH10]